jgi:hypothetical protein
MRQLIGATILACTFAAAVPASSQVKMTKEQILFYTSDWKGERFPDGRPKISDDLLKRALDVSIEDVWEYLGSLGYKSQFDGGFQALHPDKPVAEQAIISAEFTNLEDAFNFELNRLGKNGAEFEGGWTPAKYDALARWIDEHPDKLKMSRAQFNTILERKKQPERPRPADGAPTP